MTVLDHQLDGFRLRSDHLADDAVAALILGGRRVRIWSVQSRRVAAGRAAASTSAQT